MTTSSLIVLDPSFKDTFSYKAATTNSGFNSDKAARRLYSLFDIVNKRSLDEESADFEKYQDSPSFSLDSSPINSKTSDADFFEIELSKYFDRFSLQFVAVFFLGEMFGTLLFYPMV